MSSLIFFAGEESDLQDFLLQKNYSQYILLADACTNGFCVPVIKKLLPALQVSSLIVIPRGEEHKNLSACELIWERLMRETADRQTLLITIGGGMVSDIGGFAASTYKRGIDFMHIPTTLLAMVDASYGGKTAIDFLGMKNMIGTFSEPQALYIQPQLLKTLNERILRSGIAETIKHALIADAGWWEEMQGYAIDDFCMRQTLERSLNVKRQFCDEDPYDRGVRQCLNFGHSIGHAIESHSIETQHALLHGEAIMLGMYYEILLSTQLLQLPPILVEQFANIIERFFPNLPLHASCEPLWAFLRQDKKNDDHFRMSLLEQVGKCRTGVQVNEQDIRTIFAA